jgi:hypothetical protein
MKKMLILACFLAICSCNNKNNSTEGFNDDEHASLEGAWELISYFNYKSDGQVDTILCSKKNKQIKMYSNTKVMWSRKRVSDSLDWFGYGSYTVKDTLLTEVLMYGSKTMDAIIKENKAFTYKIVIGEDTFSQIEMDSLAAPIYAENYMRIE